MLIAEYSCYCSKMQSTNVEAWTSTVEADIFQNGQIISKRMDALLGSSLGSCKGNTRHIAFRTFVQFSACLVPRLPPWDSIRASVFHELQIRSKPVLSFASCIGLSSPFSVRLVMDHASSLCSNPIIGSGQSLYVKSACMHAYGVEGIDLPDVCWQGCT